MTEQSPVVRLVFVAAAAVAAVLVGISSTIGGIVVAALGAVLAVRLRPAALVTIAFAAAWLTKPIVDLLELPRFLEFLDIPLIGLAVFVAFTHAPTDPGRTLRLSARVVYLPAIAVAISTLLNVQSIVRGVASAVLLLEPLLAIVAIDRIGMTKRERERAGWVITIVLLLQVAVALLQTTRFSNADEVRGTLLGAGAGAHVMGSAVILGLVAIPFLLCKPAWLAAPLALVGIGIAVLADAKTPLYVLPVVFVAAAIVASVGRTSRRQSAGRWGIVIGSLVMLLALVLTVRFVGFQDANAKIDAATTGPNSKGAVAQQLVSQLGDDPARLVYGFGPAQSVTRLALLASPIGRQDGSPVESLGLAPETGFDATRGRVATAAFADTSVTSPTSSVLGVFGDFGLLGVIGFGYGWFAVLRLVWKRRGPGLVTIALAGWLSLIPLGLAFDWPEQPPYTLLVALLVSLATAPLVAGDRDRDRDRDEQSGGIPARSS